MRQIEGLIHYFPKRAHLFNEKVLRSDGPKCGIKPLCPTRWTVRTEAINAVIKQYAVIMETMDGVHQTTRDDYGLKAAGVLAALEKFEMFFGLKLGHLLFGAAEETSNVLQAKDTSIQEAVSAVSVIRAFYQRQWQDSVFEQNDLRLGIPACSLIFMNHFFCFFSPCSKTLQRRGKQDI